MKNVLILKDKNIVGGTAIWLKYLISGLSKETLNVLTLRPTATALLNIRKYDLVHIYEFSISGAILIYVARLYKIPTLSTVHGDFFASNTKVNPVRRAIVLLVAKACLVNSSHITTPSTYLKNILRKTKWLSPHKISLIENPIDIEYIKSINPYPRSNDITLVQITDFRYPQKARGIIETIAAIKKINNEKIKLIIVGGRGYYRHFKRKYESRRVIFMGLLSHKKALKKIKSADIIIHTSHLDNAPISILEAMACGKAIICYDTGGIKELVGDAATICSPQQFENKLRLLANSIEDRIELSKKAKFRSTLYANKIISKKFESLYNSLIDG